MGKGERANDNALCPEEDNHVEEAVFNVFKDKGLVSMLTETRFEDRPEYIPLGTEIDILRGEINFALSLST